MIIKTWYNTPRDAPQPFPVHPLYPTKGCSGKIGHVGISYHLPCLSCYRCSLHSLFPKTSSLCAKKCAFLGGEPWRGGEITHQVSVLTFQVSSSSQATDPSSASRKGLIQFQDWSDVQTLFANYPGVLSQNLFWFPACTAKVGSLFPLWSMEREGVFLGTTWSWSHSVLTTSSGQSLERFTFQSGHERLNPRLWQFLVRRVCGRLRKPGPFITLFKGGKWRHCN